MSRCTQAARPLARRLQGEVLTIPIRAFTASHTPQVESFRVPRQRPDEPSPADLDPDTAIAPWAEKELWQAGTPPVGSRRRRYAIRTSLNLPFEQLPYDCFQEARRVLARDREQKLAMIVAETAKIQRLEEMDAAKLKGGERVREMKLGSLRRYVEELKILADINDPAVKRRFEDGLGDMDKPIYRFLANRRWRSYERKIIEQRITQFNIVPDILPKFDPIYDVQLFFRRQKVPPGKIVPSTVSEQLPRLRVQPFDKGERLVSIVIMDSDVPLPDEDAFAKRCHFLAVNIPLSPSATSLPLSKMKADDQLAVPYLPAFSQMGAPYHRMSVFVLLQEPGVTLDAAKLKELYAARDGFSLKSFRDKFALTPVGFNLFRTVWDEGTEGVMQRAGVPGADIQFRPRRVYSLKPPKKARGWEAKRQGPKFRHLWKYTKRIKGLSNARGWTKK